MPVGTPGRSFQGAQVLDAKFTRQQDLHDADRRRRSKWETLFTPYNPGKGTPNLAGTFEARAFVPVPILLGLHASYVKKTNTWKLTGKATEGGLPVPGLTLKIARGTSATKLAAGRVGEDERDRHVSSVRQADAEEDDVLPGQRLGGERDYTATGCQSPLTPFAPAGCASGDALAVDGEEPSSGQAEAASSMQARTAVPGLR